MVFEPNLDKNMFDEVLDIKKCVKLEATPQIFYYEASQNLVPTCPNGTFQLGKTCDVTREQVWVINQHKEVLIFRSNFVSTNIFLSFIKKI